MVFGFIVLIFVFTSVHSSFSDEEFYNYDGPYSVGYQNHRYEPVPYFHHYPESFPPYPVQTYPGYGNVYGKYKITRKKKTKAKKGVLHTKKVQKLWKLSNDEGGVEHLYESPYYESTKIKYQKPCKEEKKHKKKTKYRKFMDKLMG
uniref:Uncharacterized protein n=1 Tax=Tetranychus urticae TaxID=32264 RepID=T1KA17_TETUR